MHTQSNPRLNIISVLNGLSPWKRWALAVNLGLTLFFILGWWKIAFLEQFWRADFSAYYTGFTLILRGQGGHLYEPQLQAQVQQQILNGRSFMDGLLSFNYPPHGGLLLAWLGFFPRPLAFGVWTLVQIGLLVFLVRLLLQIMAGWTTDQKLLALSSLLAFSPLAVNLLHGQMSLLPSLACVLLYLGMRDNSSRMVVAALLLLTIKPNLLVLPVAVVLGARRWRDLALTALIFSGWAGITTWYLGWQCWPEWLNMVAFTGRTVNQFGINPQSMYNFRSVLSWALFSGVKPVPGILTWSLLAGCAGGMLWIARCRKFPLDLQLSCCFVFAVLSAPHLNSHDALVLAPATVLFFHFLQSTHQVGVFFPSMVALGLTFFLLDYLHLLEDGPCKLGLIPLLMMALWQVHELFLSYASKNQSAFPVHSSSAAGGGLRRLRNR